MDNDDLLPNDGGYFLPREPKEQVIARKAEKAKALELLKVTEMLLEHFDERIAYRDSLDSVNVDLEKDPAIHQKVMQVNKLLKMALIEEKELLIEQIEMYSPK